MNNFYDVQQLLKRYGTIIYTGERLGDIELMDMEIEELKRLGFLEQTTYLRAKLILRNERTKEKQRKEML
jgi:uncharacterized protein YqgQ